MINDKITLSIVMPVYNEQENIELAIKQTMAEIRKFSKFELIVIDDGSIDNTNKKIINLSMKYDKLIIFKHDRNEGLSKSLKDGFNKASNDYIIFNSADLPLDPKYISNVFEQKYPFDLLVLEREKYSGATIWRKFISVCNRIILHIFFPLALIDIADCNFTFIFKKEILRNIFPKSKSTGFIQPEMILRAKYLKYNVKSIEISYSKRLFGEEHFSSVKHILYSLLDILYFRFYSISLLIRNRH